jgi:hypothetical protein
MMKMPGARIKIPRSYGGGWMDISGFTTTREAWDRP